MSRNSLFIALGSVLVIFPLLVSCTDFAGEPDLPVFMKNAPGASIHGVITFSTVPPFQVLSWSKLNANGSDVKHGWAPQGPEWIYLSVVERAVRKLALDDPFWAVAFDLLEGLD